MSESRQRRRPPKGLRYVVYAGLALVVGLMAALGGAVFLGGAGPAGPNYPDTQFAVEYYPANDTVRVTHEGGTPYFENDTDRLVVTVNGTERGEFALPVENGSATTVGGVTPPATVRVVWYSTDGATVPVGRRTIDPDTGTNATG